MCVSRASCGPDFFSKINLVYDINYFMFVMKSRYYEKVFPGHPAFYPRGRS
jgi:hypothetical protein